MANTRKHFEVLVVGGGPAGLAAAVSAAEHGAQVGLVDDNPALGGQIWRAGVDGHGREAARWIQRLDEVGVEILCGTRVFDNPAPNQLRAKAENGRVELNYQKLVLATGARERFLPFGGWTIPNVMGAGALQALVKSGFPVSGKRVVVAGTGPLLLAVAAYLREHGASIEIICEQASLASLALFAFSLLMHGDKIKQGWSLRKALSGVRFVTSSSPVAAEGESVLKAVLISRDQKLEKIPCDFLACGFHLVPNTELAELLGCRLQNKFVLVDGYQQTSIAGIYCAGEPTGIGGVERSFIEGQIAGSAAAGNPEVTQTLFGKRRKLQRFSEALDRAFALRPELREIALPETIMCRCEDVTYARLKPYASWRAAKLQTRCGMGPCQGRVCGPATEFLLGWSPDSVRPPVFPVRVENLGTLVRDLGSEFSGAMRGPQ